MAQVTKESVRKALKAKGFTEEKLNRLEEAGVEQNALPASGTFEFTDDCIRTSEGFEHLRIGVKGFAGTISLSNIQITGVLPGTEPKFGTIKKEGSLFGKAFLRGLAINPELSGHSQVALVEFLHGKPFDAEEMTVMVLPYEPNGHELAETSAETLVPKRAYRIRLK